MLLSNSKNSLKSRKKKKKISRNFWTPTNIVLLSGSLIVLPICTLIIFSFLFPLFTASLSASTGTSHYSTSIPWIDDASECEQTGRNWHDRKCWDNEHDPTF